MSLLSLLADAPDFSKTADLVVVLLNAILSPVSIIAGAICILYIIKHGLKIKKFADDPEQRNIQIYAVCWCVFGLALCIFAPIFINIILPELINSSGSYEPPTK
ncbi:Mbov_0395 family pilin-like conjugal transfer protein [Spiroplasma endosymbiont of Ammophila pubescens]|uniref:Mbov_0395 family pilin-like conjugal transfer protein n=1 Tax=Spiroplasma endosymbiont of Ammophila pubescens TaxID=3066315 RepID=UPI0032B1177F